MKRPDHPTTTADNRFTDGSAVGGVASTTLPAYVFNQIYDELVAVIEGYGLVLDGTQSNQVYQAIQAAIAAAVDAINVDLSALAPKASPQLTGVPTAPTAAAATNNTQLATTAFVHTLITNLVGGAPGALDTLKELADALGDDANFASTVTNALTLKAPLASPTLTGMPTAPTAAAGTRTTQLATTAFVPDLQVGNATCPSSGAQQASYSVVFPRAFASVPKVMIMARGNSQAPAGPVVCYSNGDETVSGFTAVFDIAEGSGQSGTISADIPFTWWAVVAP
jgi:hypothetical protein